MRVISLLANMVYLLQASESISSKGVLGFVQFIWPFVRECNVVLSRTLLGKWFDRWRVERLLLCAVLRGVELATVFEGRAGVPLKVFCNSLDISPS